MAKKKIIDFLPKNAEFDRVLIQAKIDQSLHAKVKQQMNADNITWNDLICASLLCYLEEKKAS